MDDQSLALTYRLDAAQIKEAAREISDAALEREADKLTRAQRTVLQHSATEMARKHTRSAFAVLLLALRSPDERIRIASALAILDRGHGKPAQNVRVDAETRNVTINIDLSASSAT